MMMNQGDQDQSQDALMDFLRNFQRSIETKMEDTKASIDKNNAKIDSRLGNIDEQISQLNLKIDDTDGKIEDVSSRMDSRLNRLEEQMRKSTDIRRKSEELRNAERNLHASDTSTTDRTAKETIENGDKTKMQIVTDSILQEPVGTFRSSWAKSLQSQLESAASGTSSMIPTSSARASAASKVSKTNAGKDIPQDNTKDDTPEHWEEREVVLESDWQFSKDRLAKPKTKVRRPLQITSWFGDDSNIDTSEDDSTEEAEWSNVERKKRNLLKKKKAHMKKEQKKREVATKAAHMASLGPITLQSVQYFQHDGSTFEQAKVLAVCEFLQYNLGYTREDLDAIDIVETRLSTKADEFINIALASEDDIRELYVRQAEIRNNDIIIRSYIPPSFHARFMALNHVCAEKRKEEPGLKTQLRFSHKDIDIYTKVLGEDTGYVKVDLEDFTNMSQIPEFNHQITWKRYQDKPPRRRTTLREDLGTRPSTLGQSSKSNRVNRQSQQTSLKHQLVRTDSGLSRKETSKKAKLSSSSSSSEDNIDYVEAEEVAEVDMVEEDPLDTDEL